MRLTKLYQNFFSRQNVGKQLMTLFICTILIPILMIGGIIYLYSYRQITQNYEHLSQSKATQVRSVLVSTTLYLNEICESISTDRYLWKRDVHFVLQQFPALEISLSRSLPG